MTNPNAPNFDYEDEQVAYLDYLDTMDDVRPVPPDGTTVVGPDGTTLAELDEDEWYCNQMNFLRAQKAERQQQPQLPPLLADSEWVASR